jgi:predicted dehydrogenase
VRGQEKKGVRIGIVGCGMISEVQADAIGKIEGAEVVAFCDSVRAAAEARAARFGGRVYERVEDLASDPEVDAVSICTPSGMHMEAAIVAARAKKHVIVEKPIEVTLDRIDPIVLACRTNGVKLGAVFPRRFLESSRLLRRAILAGRFGTLVLGSVYVKWYRAAAYYAKGGWRGTYAYDGGGALMNQGIHGIDLLQWLMGGVSEVAAFASTRAHEGIEVEDVAAASLSFRSGALGVVEATTGSWPGDRLRVEIAGTEGSVVMEDESFLKWCFRRGTPEDDEIRRRFAPGKALVTGGATDPRAIDSEGHRRQFEDFVRAIREDRPPEIDGSEGREAVAVITAIYRAARERRTVAVEGA